MALIFFISLPFVMLWPFSISTSLLKSLLFAVLIWLFNWTSSWLQLFFNGSHIWSKLFVAEKLLQTKTNNWLRICQTKCTHSLKSDILLNVFNVGIVVHCDWWLAYQWADVVINIVCVIIYTVIVICLWSILIGFRWLNHRCLDWIACWTRCAILFGKNINKFKY